MERSADTAPQAEAGMPLALGGAAARGLSVCFVVPRGYAVLSGRSDLDHIGGSEVQQWRIARALARRGLCVSFVTYDYGQPDGVEHDGVRAFKMCRPKAGVPGLRLLHPRWSSLFLAMRRADADIYYQRAAGAETGQTCIAAGWLGRPFVFAAASTTDCDASLPYLKTRRDRVLYRHGLSRANRIVAQTQAQVRMLQQNFGIAATLIRSCADDPLVGSPSYERRPLSSPPRVLWIGRFAVEKRVELLLELAAAQPAVYFDVVGDANAPSVYADELRRRAAALPNVRLYDSVPYAAMGRFYQRADLLLCTSAFEGFPNTFLEAWAHSVPVASTVDPDGLIARHGLGSFADSVARMSDAINEWLASDSARHLCALRCREYFLAHHTPDAVAQAYELLLSEICGPAAVRAIRRYYPANK